MSYQYTHSINCDLICGNNSGQIAVVSKGYFNIVKEQAHNKQINCIKIVNLKNSKIIIITCGEDDHINIWDA
jgi:acylphosphatase